MNIVFFYDTNEKAKDSFVEYVHMNRGNVRTVSFPNQMVSMNNGDNDSYYTVLFRALRDDNFGEYRGWEFDSVVLDTSSQFSDNVKRFLMSRIR